jgi:hypothetical protein
VAVLRSITAFRKQPNSLWRKHKLRHIVVLLMEQMETMQRLVPRTDQLPRARFQLARTAVQQSHHYGEGTMRVI